MPIDFVFESLEPETVRKAQEARAASRNTSYRPVYALNKDMPKVSGWFLSDPWDHNGTDWFNCRIGSAFQGFAGGIEAPPGNLKTFPALDKFLQNGKLVYQNDPLVELSIPNPMIDKNYDKTPMSHAKVNERLFVNFLTDEGQHMILSFTKSKGESLKDQLIAMKRVLPKNQTTLVGIKFDLWMTSFDIDQELICERANDDEAPDFPEPINCPKMLTAWRNEIEEWWAQVTRESYLLEDSVAEDELVDDYEEEIEESNEILEASFFKDMSRARLKGIIVKNNGADLIPVGAKEPMLIDIILKNGFIV
jgi:hypothetical protein